MKVNTDNRNMMRPTLSLVKYEVKDFFNIIHLILMSNKIIKTLFF